MNTVNLYVRHFVEHYIFQARKINTPISFLKSPVLVVWVAHKVQNLFLKDDNVSGGERTIDYETMMFSPECLF